MSNGVRHYPAVKSSSRLAWRNQPVEKDSGVITRRIATGRWPGWTYELVKEAGGWTATLVEDSSSIGGPRRTELAVGTFREVHTAATRHHQHPGF